MNNNNPTLATLAKLLNEIDKSAELAKLLDGTDKTADSENPDLIFITTEEACKVAHIKRWKLAEWLKLEDKNGNKLIRSFKLGSSRNSRVRIEKTSFIAYLESKIQLAEDRGEGEQPAKHNKGDAKQ